MWARTLPVMHSRVAVSLLRAQARALSSSTATAAARSQTVAVIGLGQMGRKMTNKFLEDGHKLRVYDISAETIAEIVAANSAHAAAITGCASVAQAVTGADAVISILPNDQIVHATASEVLSAHKASNPGKPLIHVSCSTISPVTSRELEAVYASDVSAQAVFVAAPVFARPDGLAKRQATWMIAGASTEGKAVASGLLQSMGNVVDFGADIGAANVVKLCGNFLIASSIESIAEAMTLAEKHGVDRVQVMQLLSSTIFDCLIYKGYGQRVAERDHRAGGFSLALGLKDVTLVNQAARQADAPMPFLSVLLDRYTSAKAKGRADFDWSAIGLNAAEDAGIDIKKDVDRNRKDIDEGRTY